MEGYLTTEAGSKYFESPYKLPQGWHAMRSTTVLDFYILRGRTVKLTRENLVPRFGSFYLIGNHPTEPDMFYLREFRDTPTYVGVLSRLRRYIKDGTLYVVYNSQQVEEMKQMLSRLYKSYHGSEGKLDYQKHYIPLLRLSLWLEDYIRYNKTDTDYKTTIKRIEENIAGLWCESR